MESILGTLGGGALLGLSIFWLSLILVASDVIDLLIMFFKSACLAALLVAIACMTIASMRMIAGLGFTIQ